MNKIISLLVISLSLSFVAKPANCVNCYKIITPNIVSDWQLSKHSKSDIGCETCYGSEHNSAANVDKVSLPTPQTCVACHEIQVT